jgi:hypothetical protein
LFSGFPESVKGCSVAFRALSAVFSAQFSGKSRLPCGFPRRLRIPCKASGAAPHSLSVVEEPESKAELARRGVRANEILNDPNLMGWLARLRGKLHAVSRPKKSGGDPEQIEEYQAAYHMAQTQALFRFLRENPDALPISNEAREAIAVEVKEQTGIELPPGMDEKWYYEFATAETSADLADVYHSHLQGDPKLKESFIEGVDKASKNPLHEAQGLPGSDATKIYLTLLFYADVVEGFESVPELHRWLRTMYSRDVVGDLKRIEGLCKGLELRFRSRGRPKKPKS